MKFDSSWKEAGISVANQPGTWQAKATLRPLGGGLLNSRCVVPSRRASSPTCAEQSERLDQPTPFPFGQLHFARFDQKPLGRGTTTDGGLHL